jgi:hypothetical protein
MLIGESRVPVPPKASMPDRTDAAAFLSDSYRTQSSSYSPHTMP